MMYAKLVLQHMLCTHQPQKSVFSNSCLTVSPRGQPNCEWEALRNKH